MSDNKRHVSKKTVVQASRRVFAPLPTHVKVARLLSKKQIEPTITFYFKPHAIHATAKDDNGITKAIKDPSKSIILTDAFLQDYKGKRKSSRAIAKDIEDMAHDLGADRFVI